MSAVKCVYECVGGIGGEGGRGVVGEDRVLLGVCVGGDGWVRVWVDRGGVECWRVQGVLGVNEVGEFEEGKVWVNMNMG